MDRMDTRVSVTPDSDAVQMSQAGGRTQLILDTTHGCARKTTMAVFKLAGSTWSAWRGSQGSRALRRLCEVCQSRRSASACPCYAKANKTNSTMRCSSPPQNELAIEWHWLHDWVPCMRSCGGIARLENVQHLRNAASTAGTVTRFSVTNSANQPHFRLPGLD